MIRIGSRENIVGDVGAEILRGVAPRCRCLHAGNRADKPALRNLPSAVDVALDIVWRALPSPGGAELHTAAGAAVHVGTLLARSRRIIAPEVVEAFVATVKLPVSACLRIKMVRDTVQGVR